VIDHSPGDLIATVSADVGLAELNAELAKAGQMLALDPPGADELTVAEVFDQALSGPRSHRYGEPRDLVLGMEVALHDGTVARSGGKVVKSVAGYDLPKLFTGARGRLGQIRELTLRLHPTPVATATVVCDVLDPLVFEPLAPACVEYAWPPGQMLVRFESPVARALADRAVALTGGELVGDDEELWAAHREAAAGLVRRGVLPAEVPAEIERLRGQGATRILGRAARGRLFSDVAMVDDGDELTPLELRVTAAYGG
jgi:glycolate oxidase FAD binding subunit